MSNRLQGKQLKINNIKELLGNISGISNYDIIYFYNDEWYIGQNPASPTLQNVTNSGNTTTINLLVKNATIGRQGDTTIVFGRDALKTNTGINNIAIGDYALENNTTGKKIIAIGNNSGNSTTNKDDLIYIGYNSAISNNGQNMIVIGHNSLLGASSNDSIVIGNNLDQLQNLSGKLIIGTSNDRILIEGDFINKKVEVKGSLTVTSKITQVTKKVHSSGASEVLVRNKITGEYEVIPTPLVPSYLEADENGNVMWVNKFMSI